MKDLIDNPNVLARQMLLKCQVAQGKLMRLPYNLNTVMPEDLNRTRKINIGETNDKTYKRFGTAAHAFERE